MIKKSIFFLLIFLVTQTSAKTNTYCCLYQKIINDIVVNDSYYKGKTFIYIYSKVSYIEKIPSVLCKGEYNSILSKVFSDNICYSLDSISTKYYVKNIKCKNKKIRYISERQDKIKNKEDIIRFYSPIILKDKSIIFARFSKYTYLVIQNLHNNNAAILGYAKYVF